MTAILRRHILVQDTPLSLDPSIKRWIKGLEHTKGMPHMITPAWCLELVLAALIRAPFEPIETCRLKYVTWKTAFLLAITSGCRASEMHALAVSLHTFSFPMLVLSSSQGWDSSPRSVTRLTCLGPFLCQQSTTRQVWLYVSSVSVGHSPST